MLFIEYYLNCIRTSAPGLGCHGYRPPQAVSLYQCRHTCGSQNLKLWVAEISGVSCRCSRGAESSCSCKVAKLSNTQGDCADPDLSLIPAAGYIVYSGISINPSRCQLLPPSLFYTPTASSSSIDRLLHLSFIKDKILKELMHAWLLHYLLYSSLQDNLVGFTLFLFLYTCSSELF